MNPGKSRISIESRVVENCKVMHFGCRQAISTPCRHHAIQKKRWSISVVASSGNFLAIGCCQLLVLLCHQQPHSVDALLATRGLPKTLGGGRVNGSVERLRSEGYARTREIDRLFSLAMRSTLTPSTRRRTPGVLKRNGGSTQTVREISEQMSQVR